MSMEPTTTAGSPTPVVSHSPEPRTGQSEPSLILPTVALPTSALNDVIQPGNEPGEDFDDGDSALGSDAGSSTGSITSSILHYRTLNGRTYHNDRNSTQYWGANDDAQNNSVDIMHHAFTLLLDNKLHLAPLPDKVEKVLDLGTGTGIWAIDFADEHPDAQVIGIDLSPIQPSWIPPNLSFQIDDFTEPWSFENNSFDFIYLRWLCGAVSDWDALFANAYRALKPGGWIESFDFDSKYLSDDDTLNDRTAIYQWDRIFNEGARKAGLNVTFNVVQKELQRKALEANNYTNMHEQRIKLPISGWPADPHLKAVGQYVRASLSNDIEGSIGYMASMLGWSSEEITVHSALVRREMAGLEVHGYIPGIIVYAQKPLDA